ncbi:MAG: reverse transcriptase/maturase family protein [Anaerovoracaceae bacterium]
MVRDPKIREIFAPDYTDRVVHHVIVDKIGKFIDKKFIYDSCANRKNKGTHFAVKRLQKFLRSKVNEYYLQADIKTFFPSIDKKILWRHIQNHVLQIKEVPLEEKRFILNICKKIVFQDPINPPPIFTGNRNLLSLVPREKSLFYIPKDKGLPIGSLTSQFFANVYLNELDQYIKHELKIKHYIRYVDDFVILGKDTKELISLQKEIQNFLSRELNLSLHPKKTVIQHKSKGIDFLGYIIRERYLLARKRTVKSFKRKLYFFNHLLDPKNFPIAVPPPDFKLTKSYDKKELIPPIIPDLSFLQKILAVVNSYYGIFSFANTYNLRKTLYENHFHHLKKYFLPRESYKMMKINPAFIEKAGR